MAFPPLVAPAASLSDAERVRTARQSRLTEIAEIGQLRLAAARVGVLGAGGIGSPVTLYLASAGVGTIGIIDDDDVERSNLQRQIAFGTADVGRPKATVAAERVRALAPDTRVIEHRTRLTDSNAQELLGGYDLIIDGSDTFDTRYAVADACNALGIPLVWGSVLRFDAQVSVFWSRPSAGSPVRLRDVFPEPPAAGTVPSCADAGVLGSLCGQVGSMLVTEAVKLICGVGEPLLGRMLVIDALSGRSREIPLAAPSGPGRLPLVSPAELAALIAEAPVTLLDVREPEEYADGTIPGARSLPLGALLADPLAVAVTGTVVVFCQQGPRARAAGRALAAAHPDADLRLLAGSYAAWSAASEPSGSLS
ncbi:HesA/MoeB/ThiF family protein [Microbacterium aurantiacum]|uniref:HesA/MoeB/ThiF family protein n=1 Tax=Microbacterium aurantiacum TaxID=162393 RepID=UPI000C800A3D|nr:HesA/MoeB/ThiF family protein [Microbacterium aurantiacum]